MTGALLKWLINVWLSITGKVCRFSAYPWLKGPVAEHHEIGADFYDEFARSNGYKVVSTKNGGLLSDFYSVLPQNERGRLNKKVAHFYEHTVQYKLEVWSQWYRPMSFFAKILIRTVSTKMNQLNIPLYPLETSRGMSNEVLHICEPESNAILYACWLRKSILSGKVVYSGFYSSCVIEGRPFVKVVFPLPEGNVTVLLKAEVQADGSVALVSHGKKMGEAGYFRVRKHKSDAVKVRRIPLKERIHVFEDGEGILRTDHKFWFWGAKLLHLHYKIMPV